MKINKIIFYSFLSLMPFQQLAIASSELLAIGNGKIEEIKVKRVNKTGKLVVKFCNELTDYSGYVEVQNKKFLVSNADVVKSKKIVWKDTNLSKTKGDAISTDNLFSEGKSITNGNCKSLGILPLLLIGAGIAAGSGSSSGSGAASSN